MSTAYKQILIKGQTSSASTPQAPQTLEYKELATDINGNVYIGNKNKKVVPIGSGSIEQNFEQSNEGIPAAVNADTLGGKAADNFMDKDTYDPDNQGINTTIQIYTHSKNGTVHEFTGNGANGRVKITAEIELGDTFTVNETPVTAYFGTENAVESMAGNSYLGKWISFIYDSEDNTLNFKGGGGGKVTVDGLSAGVIDKDATVTVKQGEKIVQSVTGTLWPTITNLSAGNVKKGTTVTVKQGSKTVQSVTGTYAPSLQKYYTTRNTYGDQNITIPNTNGKAGAIVVVVAECNQGNNPYNTMSISRQASKTVITSNGNINGKDAIYAALLTFNAGSGDINLHFKSGRQLGTIQIVCTYITY